MLYDIVVIGSGPGGYVCAIKASQLGFKVAIIEKNPSFGGTCLNIGCIPSKALLYASEVYSDLKKGFPHLGISSSIEKMDISKMMKYKESVILSNTNGISFLLKKNKIDTFHGIGRIISYKEIEILKNDTKEKLVIETKNIVIATGSYVSSIPDINFSFDENIIVSSTGALSLKKVPEKMIIVGAGVIGSELGSIWNRIGTQITIIEHSKKVLGFIDNEISKKFQEIMEKQGIIYNLETRVIDIKKNNSSATVVFRGENSSEILQELEADVVLVATGRSPYTQNLGLEEIGISLDIRGRINVNDHWETNISGIYAIGDVVKGPMLAHKASEEGIAVAEIISGQESYVNLDLVPEVIYTNPEIASIGKTEEELKNSGFKYKVGKFPFSANGRSRATMHTDGFVKILSCVTTDRILGGHILGSSAGEMIHEIAVLMEFGGSSEDLSRICHAHPTLSEAIREAALSSFYKPIHL